MKVTFPSNTVWKKCLTEMSDLGIDYASGSEKDLTVTIYSGEEKFFEHCREAMAEGFYGS